MTRAVVYTSAFNPRWRADAARGGPMGEILMGNALVDGLRRIGARVTVIESLRAFARHALARRFSFGRATYFLDPVTLGFAQRYHLLSSRDLRCAFVLDWYGTPPSRVAPGLHASQYLLPYPSPSGWNTFLGYVLDDAEGRPIVDDAELTRYVTTAINEKDRQAPLGIAWGKEGRYFSGAAGDAVRAASGVCPIHVTIAVGRGLEPGTLPPNTINHGAIDRPTWRRLLRSSAFVMGLGDPVAGPTALEALLEGCAYLDPRYPNGRYVNDVPELAIRSQHPFAATIGEPFVAPIDLDQPSSVVAAARHALDPQSRLVNVSALAQALAAFTERSYLDRLKALLAQ